MRLEGEVTAPVHEARVVVVATALVVVERERAEASEEARDRWSAVSGRRSG